MARHSRIGAACAALLWLLPAGLRADSQALLETVRSAIRTKNYPQAIDALRAASNAGDVEAQYLLASVYRIGLGVEADAKAARELLLSAARSNHPAAAYELAASYANDAPVDPEAARIWLERAASQGHPLATAAMKRGALPRAFLPHIDAPDDDARRAALLSAIRSNDGSSAAALIERSAVDAADEFGRTPLAIAAEHGAADVLRVLIELGADVNRADAFGATPLMLAAASGAADCVQLLLVANARADAVDRVGNTALMYASARAAAEPALVERLVRASAQPAVVNAQGWSALDWAMEANDARVVSLLRDHGLRARRVAPLRSEGPRAPLRRAAHSDLYEGWPDAQVAVARRPDHLLEALRRETPAAATPADLHPAVVAESEALPELVNVHAADSQTKGQAASLIWAIRHAAPATVQSLLAAGVEPTAFADGEPPLIAAVKARRGEVLKVLLESQVDVRAADEDGRTALMIAAATGQSAVVKELLQHLAPVEAADDLGRTALWYAAAAGDRESVSALLTAGSPVARADELELTPLAIAAARGHSSVVALLVQAGAQRSPVAAGASTPLMLAAGRGDVATMKLLLQGAAALDEQNRYGDTALIVAARHGRVDAVRALLEAGASTKIRNADRMSAGDVAGALGLTEVENLLSKS